MDFLPTIESRETDELIIISKSSTDEYQQEAIERAKKELEKRNISQNEIDKRLNEIFKDQNEYIDQVQTKMGNEDYSVFEKLWMIIFWPRELFFGWTLRKDGYPTKAKNRLKLIGIGIVLYLVFILSSLI